jgi:hypothetical protein
VERQIKPPHSLLLKPGAAPALALLMQEGRTDQGAARHRERRQSFGFALVAAAMLVSLLTILCALPAAHDDQRAMKVVEAVRKPSTGASQTHVDRVASRAMTAVRRLSPPGRVRLALPQPERSKAAPQRLARDFRHLSPSHRARLRIPLTEIAEGPPANAEPAAPVRRGRSAPPARPRLPQLSAPAPPPLGVIAVEVVARPKTHSPERRPKLGPARDEAAPALEEAAAPVIRAGIDRAQEFWRAKGSFHINAPLTTGSVGGRVLAGHEVPIPRRAMRKDTARLPAAKEKARCWNRIWRCEPLRTASGRADPQRRAKVR